MLNKEFLFSTSALMGGGMWLFNRNINDRITLPSERQPPTPYTFTKAVYIKSLTIYYGYNEGYPKFTLSLPNGDVIYTWNHNVSNTVTYNLDLWLTAGCKLSYTSGHTDWVKYDTSSEIYGILAYKTDESELTVGN